MLVECREGCIVDESGTGESRRRGGAMHPTSWNTSALSALSLWIKPRAIEFGQRLVLTILRRHVTLGSIEQHARFIRVRLRQTAIADFVVSIVPQRNSWTR